MSTLNQHDQCVGVLNACKLTHYPNGNAATRQHSDNEPFVSSDSSICNVSIGPKRNIDFFTINQHTGPPVKTFTLQDKSLLIMQPGVQQKLKHKLQPSSDSQPRQCLSFRNIDLQSDNRSTKKPLHESLTVILGTSITRELKPKKLVGKYAMARVMNLSSGGNKINDISRDLDLLYTRDHNLLTAEDKLYLADKSEIKNIIISVGTNDVRFKANGVHRIYTPLMIMLTKAKKLFPGTDIYLQSCLPIQPEFHWTIDNVESFNTMLERCCRETHCFYLDVVDKFLTSDPRPNGRFEIDRSYYRDNVHMSSRGLGVLAKPYIRIVRNFFDPYIKL